MTITILRFIQVAALALIPSYHAYASCGAAFCPINTQWNVQGAWTEPGVRFGLRYEYIDQDQPRSGSDSVSVGQIRRHHDEARTINRNGLASLDYTFNSSWAGSLSVPIVDRDHRHIHNHHGAQLKEAWNFTELGDVRALAHYTFNGEDAHPGAGTTGLTMGLKLPTGRIDVANGDGDRAERTLQPGTGTTDILIGAFYRRPLENPASSWFAQAQVQHPLNSHSDFRPGSRLSADLGYRHDVSDWLGIMIQLNGIVARRDTGAHAEPEDSGGTFLFASPGILYAVTKDVQFYGFVQWPLYQYVNGVQLTARRGAVIGISSRF